MLAFPNNVFVVRTANKTYAGLTKYDKSYIVSFPKREHAIIMKDTIIQPSCLDVEPNHQLSKSCHVVDMKIRKHNVPSYIGDVNEIKLSELLTFPILHNVGVIIGIDIINDIPSEMVFKSIMIDPFNSPTYFNQI